MKSWILASTSSLDRLLLQSGELLIAAPAQGENDSLCWMNKYAMFTHGNVKRQCSIVSGKETANSGAGMVLGHNQWKENIRSSG
jgi:hypothetical protein